MKVRKHVSGSAMALLGAVLCFLTIQGCLFSSDKAGKNGSVDIYHGYYAVRFTSLTYSFNLDSTYEVLWTPSDSVAASPVAISLYQGDRFISLLTSSSLPANTTRYSCSL